MRGTAAGSLPGIDFRGALGAMAELFPEILPLPELPARGVDSQLVGRALGLIEDLGFDLQPAGWRLTHHGSAEQRRARARWRHDLDDAEELLEGFDQELKVGVCGPWTLAAMVERPTGDRLLADFGARRELAQALVESLASLRAELTRRLPMARLTFQIDEPLLTAVQLGQIRTASGFSKHRSVGIEELVSVLQPLAAGNWLHCCAPGQWLGVARRAGFHGVNVDAQLVNPEELAQWLDERRGLTLGIVNTTESRFQSTDELVDRALHTLRPLGVAVPAELVLGTACGMAGWQQNLVGKQLGALNAAIPLVEEALQRG